MPLPYDLENTLSQWGQPVEDPGAPWLTQMARGYVHGLTGGFITPFKDAGKGGIPEYVGSLLGETTLFPFQMRPVAAGVALAGQLAPKLLRAGATAADAAGIAQRMFRPGLNVVGKGLSVGGQSLAYGGASALAAATPEIVRRVTGEPPEKTLGQQIRDAALSGALAGGLVRVGSSLAHRAPSATADLANTVGTEVQHDLQKVHFPGVSAETSAGLDRLNDKIASLEAKLQATPGPGRGERAGLSKDLSDAKRRKAYLEAKLQATGIAPPTTAAEPLAYERGQGLGRFEGQIAGREPENFVNTPTMYPHQREDFGARLRPPSEPEILETLPGGRPPGYGGDLPAVLGRDLLETTGLPMGIDDVIAHAGVSPTAGQPKVGAFIPTMSAPKPDLSFFQAGGIKTIDTMSDGQVKAVLRDQFGITQNLAPDAARQMLAEVASRKALPPHYGGMSVSEPEHAAPRLIGETLRDPKTGRILRGPVSEQVFPSTLTPVENTILNPEGKGTVIQRMVPTDKPGFYASKGLRIPKADVDATKLENGMLLIRNGKGSNLPAAESYIARAADDASFPDLRFFCPPGSYAAVGCVAPLTDARLPSMPAGTVIKKSQEWLRTFGLYRMLPPVAALLGTEAEKLPHIMAQADARSSEVRNAGTEILKDVLSWSPDVQRKVSRLFFDYQKRSIDEFETAVSQQVPEALRSIPQLRDLFEQMHTRYVADGVLEPEQHILNYLPQLRDRMVATAEGTLSIERNKDGYLPRTIENMFSSKPWFSYKRTMTAPDEFPEKVMLGDVLRIYLSAYGRHVATREFEEPIKAELRKVPVELMEYATDHVNAWLGNPDYVGKLSDLARVTRDYQFARTIGGNVMSPIVNKFQMLNAFALAHPTSFFQGLQDARDPERLKVLGQAGLGNLLAAAYDKGDVSPGRAGSPITGMAALLAQKLGGLFAESERSNRIQSFMIGLREAERNGAEPLGKDAMDFARRFVNDTQFIASGANAVPALRDHPYLAQFQNFRLNQVGFMFRLLDQATQGGAALMHGDIGGALTKMAPFIKFWTPIVALTGSGFLPGDWAEEQATRAIWGKATQIPGLMEYYFGVSLQNQLGLGSVGIEDIPSFMFYLPGPSFGFVQGLLSMGLGMNLGHGLDVSSLGRDLSPQERYGLLVQSLPAGIQAQRVLQGLRLLQTDGKYRQALDVSQIMGLTPATGDLMAGHAAKLEQILLGGAGFQDTGRHIERRLSERQQQIEKELSAAEARSASLLVGGKYQASRDVMADFYNKYKDQLFLSSSGPSSRAIQAAMLRQIVPPVLRRRPMEPLLGSEPFLGPPKSLFSEYE